MFNGSIGNTISWNYMGDLTSSNSIYLQYYLDQRTSIRGGIRLGNLDSINQEFIVKDQMPIPDADVLVTDKKVVNSTNLILSGYYLMHRGKGRVRGYYGGGVQLIYRTSSQSYSYGNPITTTFNAPATTNFGPGIPIINSNITSNITSTGRVTGVSNVVSMGAGLHALVGVEYFFAPKVSVGGEFGYGVLALRNNVGQVTEERWNGTEIETERTDVANDGEIKLDNTNFGGAIYLKFHF
jgi:hypothetical protein